MHIGIVGVHLTTTGVNRQEHGFDTTRGLCHQTGCSRWGNCQTSNVSASVLYHIGIQSSVGILDAQDERIVLLALRIKNLESTTFLGHLHTRTISVQRQCFMHLHAEVSSLLCTIAQSHSSYHVTFGCDTHTRTTTFRALCLDFLPQVQLGALHLHRLRVALHLLHDEVNLLQLQVNDVVHQSLGHLYMFLEQLIVEVSILREGVLHIAVQVDAQQSAGVVRTQGNLTTRIRGNGAEAQIGIAIGNALPQDSVPEQHTRLGTLPSVVNYLFPEFLGADFLLYIGVVARNGELLYIRLVFRSTAHELIVNLH